VGERLVRPHDPLATRRLVRMADNDDRPENDITDPTSEEHGDVHRRFVELWNERTSGDEGAIALDSAWEPIANLLEGHAGVETEANPALPQEEVSDEASGSHTGAQ
jgi:hypothetical protein